MRELKYTKQFPFKLNKLREFGRQAYRQERGRKPSLFSFFNWLKTLQLNPNRYILKL